MHKLTTEHMMASCKFRFLSELLPKLKEAGSRPLIFSQWTSMLDIIEWLMDFLQLPYVRLDGSTAVDERLATVDRFNNGTDDVFAFLLSTRAFCTTWILTRRLTDRPRTGVTGWGRPSRCRSTGSSPRPQSIKIFLA